jgi:phage shock protein A
MIAVFVPLILLPLIAMQFFVQLQRERRISRKWEANARQLEKHCDELQLLANRWEAIANEALKLCEVPTP